MEPLPAVDRRSDMGGRNNSSRTRGAVQPVDREVGDSVRRLQGEPVSYTVEPSVTPGAVHVLGAVDHLVLGEVVVVAAPDAERRDAAGRPTTTDREGVVRAIPVQPRRQATRPGQVGDGLVEVGVPAGRERAESAEVVDGQRVLADTGDLPWIM